MRKAKTLKATETVHGQHQALDKNYDFTVRTAVEERSRWKEIVSQVREANDQT